MTATVPTGRLALWNDCAPGEEAFYEHWYQTEHLHERLAIPGFRHGRRYRAVEGTPDYFTYYEVESPEILTSPAYRARLDDPTPATRRVMSGVFRNMSRTLCRVTAAEGRIRGAFAVTARLDQPIPLPPADSPDIARVELWQAIPGSAPSEEERLRGGDASTPAALLVETLTEHAARRLAATLPVETGIYRLLCTLDAAA